MINKYLAMGLGALIAVAPVAAMAKTSTAKSHHTASKTHKSHTASKSHHTAKKATAPEAPKS
jgi:hypothetical protein